ncbi:MAG: hypothetical protein AAB544_03085, partial [Patescibacteria group bacterium]
EKNYPLDYAYSTLDANAVDGIAQKIRDLLPMVYGEEVIQAGENVLRNLQVTPWNPQAHIPVVRFNAGNN